MASQGTILSAKRKNGTNSFDGDGTLDLLEKTFDGSYFSTDNVGKKMSSLKHSLTSCNTQQIHVFPSFVSIHAYILHLSVRTRIKSKNDFVPHLMF